MNDDFFIFPVPQSFRQTGGEPQRVASLNKVITSVDPNRVVRPQGYRLTIDRDGVEIVGHDDAGVFYGRQTLRQLIRGESEVPLLVIDDWPDLLTRGYMLDVSRDRVPTMTHLHEVVETMARLKLNQLQLYTEHTVAFEGHESVWRDASPLTFDELAEIETFAAARFIDLVPCQNAFGHLHHWLTKPGYRDLAECPDGWDTPWGYRSPEPFSLNPGDPRSLALSQDLIAQLAQPSKSKLFNIGCDETLDIGQGRSRARVEREGRAEVYFEYLTKLCATVNGHGKTPMFWGDIVLHHPELIPRLPDDAILLNWGYEADHPFDKQSKTFADAGVRFYVCPGTSGWCTLTGRGINAVKNLRAGAAAAVTHGAEGFLITDWGDYGHWQPYPVSLPGLVYGAGVAWAMEANTDAALLPAAISLTLAEDPNHQVGRVIWDASNVYQQSEAQLFNATWWFQYLRNPDQAMSQISFSDAKRVTEAFASILHRIEADRAERSRCDQVLDEMEWCVGISHWAAQRTAEGITAGRIDNVKSKGSPTFDRWVSRFAELWLRRSRPGGLDASIEKLKLRSEATISDEKVPF